MSMPTFSSIDVSLDESGMIATWRIHHGKANEMGSVQIADLEQLVAWCSSSEGPIALVSYADRTSSRGTPIFIAGANVTERVEWSPEMVKAHVRRQRLALNALRYAPVFHVCVVNGVALGWGTEFLLTADYRIGAPGAVFGLPETSLGILPGAGGTSELWQQIGVAQAMRLGMTGERIDLDEAYRMGLVQEQSDSLAVGLERAHDLCARVAKNSPTAVAAFKRGLLKSIGAEKERRLELEAKAYEHCVDTGQAKVGRENFSKIRAGEMPDWGPRTLETY